MKANDSIRAVLCVAVATGFTEQGKCMPPSAFLFSPLTGSSGGSVGMPQSSVGAKVKLASSESRSVRVLAGVASRKRECMEQRG